ncbi:MAG: hypothetical protein ACTSPI_12790 [Candidatus Heimdallarchaeaceae archaeon]
MVNKNLASMKLIRKIVLFCTLLLITISFGIKSSAYVTYSTSNSSLLTVHIQTAYYADLEGDGKENDIFTSIYISFYSIYYYNHLYAYLELDLPSGEYYAYLISLEFYGIQEVTLPIYLYNHATESGDYILYVAAFFADDSDILAESIAIFDPPGGTDGADPPRIEIG